jgi:hypothetical protein
MSSSHIDRAKKAVAMLQKERNGSASDAAVFALSELLSAVEDLEVRIRILEKGSANQLF